MTDRDWTPGARALPQGVRVTRKRLADGTERAYYYHRKTGRPIKAEPGTPAFVAALRDAAQPKAASPRLDLKWLVTIHMASPEYAALATATKAVRARYFDIIVERFAGALVEWFDDERMIPTLYQWRDEMRTTPGQADNLLACLSALMSWAKKRRIVRHNWVREIDRLTPAGQSRAEFIWTPEMWGRLIEKAHDDERRLLLFASFTAARRSDIANLLWANFDGKWLVFKPQKTERRTGAVVQLPVYALPPFAELMASLPRSSERLLVTARGKPWTWTTIGDRMRFLKARAFPEGAPDRTFHDIRGTTVTRLFNAGCSDAEVASINGHAISRGSLKRYAERSRQLALNAYNRWCAAEFSQGAQIVEFRR